MIKPFLNLCLAILTAGSFYGHQAADGHLITAEPTPGDDALSGSYSIVVESYDWGSAVSSAILSLEQPVSEVSPEQFLVVEEKQSRENSSVDIFATSGDLTISRGTRTVTGAYLCDAEGTPTKEPSTYVALELQVGPNIGSPVCYHPDEQHYRWADPYRLVIELAPGKTITSGRTQYSRLAISRTSTQRHMPYVEEFTTARYSGVDHNLSYASYAPQQDGTRHPLVIWLHGLGEGGTNPLMPLWGGKVSTFVEPEFQQLTGGAHVLVPQCPTFWLDDGTGTSTSSGKSTYTQDLLSLIRYYITTHPDVDPNRIYIGGCSNGGYMTLALLLEAPQLFAAAFPTCQAYQDSWLSDEDIQILKNIPLWFTHSELDRVCPPGQSTFPTVERLRAAGANNVHLIKLRDISVDSYRYNPHYAWIPVLNGQCSDPATSESLFSWLTSQTRSK